MTRPDGFPVADVDVGLLEDGKFRLLWRRLRDATLMSHAVTAYLAVLLASWQAGERLCVDEAVPTWFDPDAAVVEAMREVSLLDDDQRLPERAWLNWYGPARARREERRASGRKGGLAKAGNAAGAQND